MHGLCTTIEGLVSSPPRRFADRVCASSPRATCGLRAAAAVGYLTVSDHCSGQEDIPATGILHQHSPARASLAIVAPRTYPASLCLLHAFAVVNAGGNRFCLCRLDTGCDPEVFSGDAVPSEVKRLRAVAFSCCVSHPCAVSWCCVLIQCTGIPLFQGTGAGE